MFRYDKARDVFRQSLAVNNTPRTRWLLGDALCELGDWAEAETQYQAVQTGVATPPERAHALQQLLQIYRTTGEDAKAAECKRNLNALQATPA